MKLVLKDLHICGGDGVLLIEEIWDLANRKRESLLDSALKEIKPTELILINFFGDHIVPSKAEEIIHLVSREVEKVSLYPRIDVFDSVLLPENVEVLEESPLDVDISSDPVNNVPKVFADERGIIELDIPPLWILELDPDDPTPVSTVERFVKEMEKGSLIVVLYTYLLKAEEEAIDSFVEGTGGFVVKLHKHLLEPKDEIETEFMKRMRSRVGKYVGMRALRGEIG